jgi:hypothetical protein
LNFRWQEHLPPDDAEADLEYLKEEAEFDSETERVDLTRQFPATLGFLNVEISSD